MLNYLYYKLYGAALKSSLRDIPSFMAAVSFGGLISANVLVISAFLAKLDIMPFIFSSKEEASVFAFIIIIFIMFYFREKRFKSIIRKYSQESNKERIRGNIIVAVYVALSFLLIFAVAFYKPGKL